MKPLLRNTIILTSVLCGVCPGNAERILTIQPKNVFTNTAQLELIAALSETNFQVAEAILKTLDVDASGTNGATALWWEANVGNLRSFEYLLKKKANPGLVVTDTYNTLELCAKQDEPRFLEAAIEHGGNVNTIGYFTRQTPIYAAINARMRANVELLLRKGAYANVSDPTGITPALWAAESRAFDLVALLLKNGANPDARDNSGVGILDVMLEVHPKAGDFMYESYKEAMRLLEKDRKK